jgi:hypothetical protein
MLLLLLGVYLSGMWGALDMKLWCLSGIRDLILDSLHLVCVKFLKQSPDQVVLQVDTFRLKRRSDLLLSTCGFSGRFHVVSKGLQKTVSGSSSSDHSLSARGGFWKETWLGTLFLLESNSGHRQLLRLLLRAEQSWGLWGGSTVSWQSRWEAGVIIASMVVYRVKCSRDGSL